MTKDQARALTDSLGRVKAGWPGQAGWEWDGRLVCALSTVGKDDEASARELLAAGFPAVWTPATLSQAPAPLQQVCAQVGGLRNDQLVLSVELGGVFAFCLWWPWGGSTNFSARIGTTGDDDLDAVVRTTLGVK
jgi:hypothetical protein